MPSSFPSRPSEPASATDAEEAILVMPTATLPPTVASSLRAAGYALLALETDEEVHRFLEDSIPAAVLLGRGPTSGSYDLVRRIRRRDRLAFVQIVVLVSNPADLAMGEAITSGADDCMDVSRIEDGEIVDCILARIARARSQAELALLDPLTGLHNRRFMNDRLPAEIARTGRTGGILSLALIDLDDFKSINDRFGHTAGDRVLAAFSRALSGSFRSYDAVCRFGGDEFVISFPDCDAEHATVRLDELRRKLAGIVSDPALPTFTAGVATCPRDGVSWDELFEVADGNLRRAKQLR